MANCELTKNEKLMIYGLSKYPNFTDKKLSEKINLKHSTVTSIRHRLKENEFYRSFNIPRLQNMGCKMLVVIYSNFSPIVPLEERVKITGKTIEVFDEIFFSAGVQDKGFSLSLAKNYASIGKINDIRTKTFGGRGLLEDEYPNMIVFPFEISKIYRFFDYAPLLKNNFNLDLKLDENFKNIDFKSEENIILTNSEKNIYCMLIQYPELQDREIGEKIGVSRHTVSRVRRNFEEKDLIRKINLPNLKKLGFEILTFSHIKFDPRNSPNMEKDEASLLLSNSTILMASRMFEAFMLSAHLNYDDYNKDKTRVMQILKEKKWIAKDPKILTYSLNELIVIKDFRFAPIAKKIIGCELEL